MQSYPHKTISGFDVTNIDEVTHISKWLKLLCAYFYLIAMVEFCDKKLINYLLGYYSLMPVYRLYAVIIGDNINGLEHIIAIKYWLKK